MQGDERAALVCGGKIVAFVEDDLKGRGVRLHEHVRNRDLALQVGPRADAAGLGWRPGSTRASRRNAPLTTCGRIFERRVVAELVALVDGAPEQSRRRLDRDAGKLRRPVATIFMFLPSGSKESTSARQLLGIPGGAERLSLARLDA